MMNPINTIESETCVADLLRDYPATIPVFLKHQMACVGCSMSSFETVRSAAGVYGIAPETLLGELRAAISAENTV